jgi:predicted nucleic acid-binding protein
MTPPLIADTGGLLRALARTSDAKPSWPDYHSALHTARAVIVPALVLAEVDYFLRDHRAAMRKLIAELFDPATTYEYEVARPADIARALELDAKFAKLELGLVDGTVAAVAERRGVYRILTTDRTDFATLRVGARYQRALTLVP